MGNNQPSARKKTYYISLAILAGMFFIFGFVSWVNSILIPYFRISCELTHFESYFVAFAFYIAYFVMAIPSGILLKKVGFKKGIMYGFMLTALGAFIFVPAALARQFEIFLIGLFSIGTGLAILQTAANPYVTVLGAPETAPRRLNLAQSFNGLGAFIAAMFLSKLILSGTHYTRETLPVDYPGGWQAYIQVETDAMKFPYLMLALLLIIIAVVFVFSKLPQIGDESKTPSSGAKKEKLIDFGVLKHSHLRWGVIAQFFYNGGQTAINSLFLVYCCSYAGLPEETATTFFGLYMLAFLVGRWIGTGLMVRFRPQDMLLVYSLMNILLCGVVMVWGGMVGLYAMLAISFFMSIMYPTQFSLALKGLGDQTKSGSAFLVMAIVGNACLPQLTAYFMHANEHIYYAAYCVPMICFIFCAYYGWKGYKVID